MAHKQIREKLREEYESQREAGGYNAVAASWGLTSGMVWRIVNEPDYWPSDPEIRERVIFQAQLRGVLVRRPGRKRDLFSLEPEELAWMVENRLEV